MSERITTSMIIVALILLGLTACSQTSPATPSPTLEPSPSPTPLVSTLAPQTPPALPADEYSRYDKIGDGYIASIKVEEGKGQDSIAIMDKLVTQWLEHYKTQ